MTETSKCLKAAALMMGAIFVLSGACGSKKAVDAPNPDGGGGGDLGSSAGGTPGPDGGEGGTGPSGGRAGTGGAGGSGGPAMGGRGGGGAGGMAGGCPTGTHILYTTPGCGTKAAPICHNDSSAGGACLSQVCGCDGKVHADSCGSSSVPFAYFTSFGGNTVCDPQGGTSGSSIGGAGGGAPNNDGGTDACSIDNLPRGAVAPVGGPCPTNESGPGSCVPGTYCYTTSVCSCGVPEPTTQFLCDCSGHRMLIATFDPADCFNPCPTGGRSGR